MSDTGLKITEQRGSVYGPFCENARVAQKLKFIFRSTSRWGDLTDSQREALDLIALKVSRILTGNDSSYPDNWVDISGYADLIVKELNT